MRYRMTGQEGFVIAILSNAISVRSGFKNQVPVTFTEMDATFQPGTANPDSCRSPWDWKWSKCLLEKEWGWAESKIVRIKAKYTICTVGLETAIIGEVEAIMRIFRKNSMSPWKLHYLMYIQPHLHEGHIPIRCIRSDFADWKMNEQSQKNPGKFWESSSMINSTPRELSADHQRIFMKICDLHED